MKIFLCIDHNKGVKRWGTLRIEIFHIKKYNENANGKNPIKDLKIFIKTTVQIFKDLLYLS